MLNQRFLADFILIAVPAPHDPTYGGEMPTNDLPAKDFDYSYEEQVCGQIAPFLCEEQTVVVVSTVRQAR